MILQIVSFILMLFWCSVTAAQNPLLTYVKTVSSDQEIERMNDSLPFLIVENRVYQIRSECVMRRNDFGYKGRLGGAEDDDRLRGEGDKGRLSDGGVNNRLYNDGEKGRLEGGGGSERMSGSGAGGRNASGGIDELSCGIDEWGRLIIYVENPKTLKQARLYYEKRFYAVGDKFFKIKKN